MDRDNRWDRTEKALNAFMRGFGDKSDDFLAQLDNFYSKKVYDEWRKA